MRFVSEMWSDGPYVRVLLPDVLPPDWEALRRDLEPEIAEGATRVLLIAGECAGFSPADPGLAALVGSLRDQGIEAIVVEYEGA